MEKLIEEIRLGKKGAVAKLYGQLSPAVRNYIRGRVEKEEDVEELLQDTFISALDSLALYLGKASFKTFVFAIAKHEIADWYRKRYVRQAVERTAPVFEGMMAEFTTPEWTMKKNKMKAKFYQVYASLSEPHRDVLSYRFELGMSVKEIAERMDLSFKATESLLFRARAAFKASYEQE